MSFSRAVCDNNLVVGAMIPKVRLRGFTIFCLPSARSWSRRRSCSNCATSRHEGSSTGTSRYLNGWHLWKPTNVLATGCTSATRLTDCRDPKDNMLLELALSGHADLIVTGDNDLLCLHPWRGIAILSPADYLHLWPR